MKKEGIFVEMEENDEYELGHNGENSLQIDESKKYLQNIN